MTTAQLEYMLGRSEEIRTNHIPMLLCVIALQLSRMNDREEQRLEWSMQRDAEDLALETADAERREQNKETIAAMRDMQERMVNAIAPQMPGRPKPVPPVEFPAHPEAPTPSSQDQPTKEGAI